MWVDEVWNHYEMSSLKQSVACSMVKSSNKWIKVAWEREWTKETNPTKNGAIAWMHTVGTVIGFEEDCILLDGEKTQKTGNQHGYQ